MAFDDRLTYLLLGMFIGWVLRLVVEAFQRWEEVFTMMGKELASRARDREQKGFMRIPWAANTAIFIVVAATVWASIVSQRASNAVENQQKVQHQTIYCVKSTLSESLIVLNARSTYTKRQIQANTKLQTDFSKLFNLLLEDPPVSEKKRVDAAHAYQASLNHFVDISVKQRNKVETNKFPTSADLKTCLARDSK